MLFFVEEMRKHGAHMKNIGLFTLSDSWFNEALELGV
jgi:hypothetical protein